MRETPGPCGWLWHLDQGRWRGLPRTGRCVIPSKGTVLLEEGMALKTQGKSRISSYRKGCPFYCLSATSCYFLHGRVEGLVMVLVCGAGWMMGLCVCFWWQLYKFMTIEFNRQLKTFQRSTPSQGWCHYLFLFFCWGPWGEMTAERKEVI